MADVVVVGMNGRGRGDAAIDVGLSAEGLEATDMDEDRADVGTERGTS